MQQFHRRAVLQGGLAVLSAPWIVRPAAAADIRIHIGSDTPASYAENTRIVEAASRIKTRTDGKVDIRVFPNSSLGSDMLNQVHSGSLDFFLCSSQLAVPLVPACALPGTAYGLPDTDTAFKSLDGDLGTYLRGEMEKVGLYAIPTAMQGGWRQIISDRPIKTPDDLSGFKIRVPISPMWVSQFNALGASPTPISIDELYTALQTKVVNGAENYPSLLYAMRLYEIAKYLTATNHMWDCYWILGNAKKWNAIPQDLQQVMLDEFTASALQQRKDMAEVDAAMPDRMRAAGMTIIEPDRNAFRDRLKKAGYYDQWRQKFGPQGWALLERYAGSVG